METKLCIHIGLLFCMLSCFLRGACAQSDCNTTLITLNPCYPYIEPGNTTKPGVDCCSPIAALFASDATCLCQIAPIAQQFGITINQTRALDIATLCNQTDIPTEVTNCLSGIAPTPSISPSNSIGAPPTATNGSSSTTPSRNNDGSFASILSPPLLLLGSIFVTLSLHFIMPS